MDKNNKWIDIDILCKPGSLIFFNGRHKHKVELIKSEKKQTIPSYILNLE